mmetsp:Transcript_31894/g.83573  ORF Transcript_31894/g.83573 Transcript_31894/m.83573 type:complete len:142 (-) Transcript_31894:246-671(-)
MLPDDLAAANVTCSGADCVVRDTAPPFEGVSYFRTPEAAGSALLVRQLRPMPGLVTGVSTSTTKHDIWVTVISSVDANVTATAGNFVTLLYPLAPGEALPQTTWSDDGKIGVTTASGCVDTVTLSPADGHPFNKIAIQRSV